MVCMGIVESQRKILISDVHTNGRWGMYVPCELCYKLYSYAIAIYLTTNPCSDCP